MMRARVLVGIALAVGSAIAVFAITPMIPRLTNPGDSWIFTPLLLLIPIAGLIGLVLIVLGVSRPPRSSDQTSQDRSGQTPKPP
jgi:hypothetical protein